MRRVTIFVVLMILILTVHSRDSASLDKQVVEVKFVLADPDYRNEFDNEQIPQIENKITGLLIEHLLKRLDYLEFAVFSDSTPGVEAIVNPNSRIILTCELNRRNPNGPGQIHDVGIHIRLTVGGQAVNHEPVFWLFRPKEAIDWIEANEEEFATAIDLLLEDVDYSILIAKVLRNISIAQGGRLIKQDELLACIIPLRPDELCMDSKSILVLEMTIPSDMLGSYIRDFQAGYLTVYNPSNSLQYPELCGMIVTEIVSEKYCQELRDADQDMVQVEGIYVEEYYLDSFCRGALPPDDAFSGEGGTQ